MPSTDVRSQQGFRNDELFEVPIPRRARSKRSLAATAAGNRSTSSRCSKGVARQQQGQPGSPPPKRRRGSSDADENAAAELLLEMGGLISARAGSDDSGSEEPHSATTVLLGPDGRLQGGSAADCAASRQLRGLIMDCSCGLAGSTAHCPPGPSNTTCRTSCCSKQQLLGAVKCPSLPPLLPKAPPQPDSHASGMPTMCSQTLCHARCADKQGRCKCGKRITSTHPPCKSELMLLCEKFLQKFGRLQASGTPSVILLNNVTNQLNVPRRRIYDIINCLEAVEVIVRTGKLAYIWKGHAHLPSFLACLAREEEAGVPLEDRVRKTAVVHPVNEGAKATFSLWMLTRKFVRKLLVTQGPIPLSEAALQLIGETPDTKKQQTQITVERRIYDIASILQAIGLVEKTYLGKRQPAFTCSFPWRQAVAAGSAYLLAPQPGAPAMQSRPAGSSVAALHLPFADPLHNTSSLPHDASAARMQLLQSLPARANSDPLPEALPGFAGAGCSLPLPPMFSAALLSGSLPIALPMFPGPGGPPSFHQLAAAQFMWGPCPPPKAPNQLCCMPQPGTSSMPPASMSPPVAPSVPDSRTGADCPASSTPPPVLPMLGTSSGAPAVSMAPGGGTALASQQPTMHASAAPQLLQPVDGTWAETSAISLDEVGKNMAAVEAAAQPVFCGQCSAAAQPSAATSGQQSPWQFGSAAMPFASLGMWQSCSMPPDRPQASLGYGSASMPLAPGMIIPTGAVSVGMRPFLPPFPFAMGHPGACSMPWHMPSPAQQHVPASGVGSGAVV